MNSKHKKTLKKVFKDPILTNIKWVDIEKLLTALGAETEEAAGSRIMVSLDGLDIVFHRPHPKPEANRYVIKIVRQYLIDAGIEEIR